MIKREDITAVILAGGRGKRMGGADKGLVEFEGHPLIAHAIELVTPLVKTLLISANRNLMRYQQFGYPVVTDSLSKFQGPLAGILAAMETVRTPYILTLPCDGPRLPVDLVERLANALQREEARVAVAHDGQRRQSTYALIPVDLKQHLRNFLANGDRKLGLWLESHRLAQADYSDTPSVFANINSEMDKQRLLMERDA